MIKKKCFLLILLPIFLTLTSGCETTKGVAKGVATGVGATAQGIAKDSSNLWQGLLKADAWIKKNLW